MRVTRRITDQMAILRISLIVDSFGLPIFSPVRDGFVIGDLDLTVRAWNLAGVRLPVDFLVVEVAMNKKRDKD
jgi:hypothetical protein